MAEWFVGEGQQKQSLGDAIAVAQAGDMITITDSRTYSESLVQIMLTDITVRSNKSDPDLFPVLKLNMDYNTLNFINNWIFRFVTFEPNGSSRFTFNLQNITFRNSVFRNFDYLLACDCLANRKKTFESCLFYNITDYVFNALQNYEAQALVIKNCTFHNCANIFKNDFWNEVFARQPQFTNNLFTACPNIASQAQDTPNGKRQWLFQQFRYCTFSNNPQTANSQLGSNCYLNENISDIYSQTLKELPAHFRIKDNPRIRNCGDDTFGYSPDIGNRSRTSPFDRGAWEFDGGNSNRTMILPFINYQGVP